MRCSIVGGSYLGRSIGIDAQECVNLYPEIGGPEAKNVAALIGTPGLELFHQIGTLPQGCRGLFTTARDRLLMVIGASMYEVSPSGSSVIRGHLNTNVGPVSFAESDKQPDPASAAVSEVMLVDGANGYIFNTATDTFTVIGGDYLPGTSVISQNGFFIQNINASNKFIYSNYLDGLSWEASLNFFAAESSPDPIMSIFLINNQVWLFGSKTIEIWNFTGDPDILWTRSGVGFINTGTAGKNSTALINGNILWIGSGPTGQNIVWRSGPSYMPERVSTHAIEYIISKMPRIDDCVALSYQAEGHQFVIFNFPTGNRTLCYDLTTELWHERGDLDVSKGINNRHRAMFLTNWQGKIMVGDDTNNNLYIWNLDHYTDNGKSIRRIRVAPHIHTERKRLMFKQLEIDMEKGIGLQSGQGSNPQVMLRFSNDGGYTYSPINLWQTAGTVGSRMVRVQYNKLGMSRDRVFEISMTDPCKWILIDARMNVSVAGS